MALPLGQGRHDDRLRDRLPFDVGHAPHPAGAGPDLEDVERQAEAIPGDDRLAKARLVDPGEVDELRGSIRDLVEDQIGPRLGERLDDEHAGHHGGPREVPGEERLVDRDVLDRDDALPRHDLHDPIDEQERITMRHPVQDAADVGHAHGLAGGLAAAGFAASGAGGFTIWLNLSTIAVVTSIDSAANATPPVARSRTRVNPSSRPNWLMTRRSCSWNLFWASETSIWNSFRAASWACWSSRPFFWMSFWSCVCFSGERESVCESSCCRRSAISFSFAAISAFFLSPKAVSREAILFPSSLSSDTRLASKTPIFIPAPCACARLVATTRERIRVVSLRFMAFLSA